MASELHVDAIKHSGGTSALTIDSSGNVKIPGSVIQVVNGNYPAVTSSSVTSSSFTEVNTGIRTSMTPKFSDSKIFIICNMGIRLYNNGGADANGGFRLYDITGDSAVSGTTSALRHYDYGNSGHYSAHPISFNILMDSWGTTAKTFNYQLKLTTGTGIGLNDDSFSTSMTLVEISQ